MESLTGVTVPSSSRRTALTSGRPPDKRKSLPDCKAAAKKQTVGKASPKVVAVAVAPKAKQKKTNGGDTTSKAKDAGPTPLKIINTHASRGVGLPDDAPLLMIPAIVAKGDATSHDFENCSDPNCKDCKSKKMWDDHGERLLKASATEHAGLAYCWAAWKDGVGCLLCANLSLELQVLKAPSKSRCRALTKWGRFRAKPFLEHHFIDHGKTKTHQSALKFHVTGVVDVPNISLDDLKKGREQRHEDEKDAFRRLVSAVEKGISQRAFIEQEKTAFAKTGRIGFLSILSYGKGLWCTAEVQRRRWQDRLKGSKTIFVTSDGAGKNDVMNFDALDKSRKKFIGTFGLTQFGQRSDLGEGVDRKDLSAAEALAAAVMNCIKTFCFRGRSDCEQFILKGEFREGLYQHVNLIVRGSSFDGLAYAQIANRLLSRNHWPNSIIADRDTLHDCVRIFDECAAKDPSWAEVSEHLFDKKRRICQRCPLQHETQTELHCEPRTCDKEQRLPRQRR